MLITKKKTPDAIIVVGPYRIPVKHNTFKVWETKLMRKVGFTDSKIKAEILRRLGYEA